MSLENAACKGQHELFDSVDLADHEEAAAICATCPARLACLQELHKLTIYADPNQGGPVGTWAGQLIGATRKTALERLREHGTSKGYYRSISAQPRGNQRGNKGGRWDNRDAPAGCVNTAARADRTALTKKEAG